MLNSIKKMKKSLPEVKIFADVSTTSYNSAMTFFSMCFHKIFYKKWIKKNEKYFNKIYYVAPECKKFLINVYKINEGKLFFSPLPCEVIESNQRKKMRNEFEQKYGLNSGNIIFSHTGKYDERKLTIELIDSFMKTTDNRFRLFLAGSFSNSIQKKAMEKIGKDKRIVYLNFFSKEELIFLLCATDLYLQPGTASQTAQTAMGCGCPLVVANIPVYKELIRENGYIIENIKEIDDIFKDISNGGIALDEMSKNSFLVAKNLLDYKKIVDNIYR